MRIKTNSDADGNFVKKTVCKFQFHFLLLLVYLVLPSNTKSAKYTVVCGRTFHFFLLLHHTCDGMKSGNVLFVRSFIQDETIVAWENETIIAWEIYVESSHAWIGTTVTANEFLSS